MNRPRVLFAYNNHASFIHYDLECLKKEFIVDELYLADYKISPSSIWKAVASHDLVFGWFASWHTFLPILYAKVLNKPSLLVVGGYDTANMPEIHYGHQRGGLKKWISRSTMQLSTRLISFSHFSQSEATKNASIPQSKIKVLYLGVPDKIGELSTCAKEPFVLSVGNIDRPNLFRKGHELFVRSAAYLPETDFYLVGSWLDDAIDQLKSTATPNVKFTGRLAEEDLIRMYQKASVYVQVSYHEGFGLSVAEAMLAGCIPVVSCVGSLSEVVGENGIYINSFDPRHVAAQIQCALEFKNNFRVQVRNSILKRFSVEKRARELSKMIDQVLSISPVS